MSHDMRGERLCPIVRNINGVMDGWGKVEPRSALDGLARLKIALKGKNINAPAVEIIDRLMGLG